MAEMQNSTEPSTTQTGQDPHGSEPAPVETVSRADYDKAVAESRKWEKRAKDNIAAAKELDELKKQTMTSEERAQAEKARADKAEAELAGYRAKAERESIVSEVAAAKRVDADILSRMAGDTRDELEEAADWLSKKLASAPIYPSVSDKGAGKTAPVTKEQIDAIKDPKERIRMRAKHIDLYSK